MSFDEYLALGYSAIQSGNDFARIMARAGRIAERETMERVNQVFLAQWIILDPDEPPEFDPVEPGEDAADWYDMMETIANNKRGLAEIADILYQAANSSVTADGGAAIASFRNEGYSETYVDANTPQALEAQDSRIDAILYEFFEPWQLYRGVVKNHAWR